MEQPKHAYLILAHQDFEVLRCLLVSIDDERNDIYIHFDQKVVEIPQFKLKNAKLVYLENRESIYWGDVSMLYAEYNLMEKAYSEGNYVYYHLISGVDMPLKSQNYIHNFFNVHQDKLFIGYSQADRVKEIERRISTYHIFSKDFRDNGSLGYYVKKSLRYAANNLQRLFGVKREYEEDFRLGPQWFSVGEDFIKFLLEKKSHYINIFKYTYCSDELFVQTAAWNSRFRKNIYNELNEFDGCMRAIQWKDGSLINWRLKDYDHLVASEALFARKFSEKDIDIVYALMKNVTNQ